MAQNWSFIGAGAVGTGTSSVACAVPSGYAAGDILIICLNTLTASATTPTGWTAASSNGNYAKFYHKTATSSESTVTVTVTGLSSGVMLCYRSLSGFDSVSTLNTGSSTSATTNTLTTAATYDLVVSMFGSVTSKGGYTQSTPSGTTLRVSEAPATTAPGFIVVDEAQAASGTSTARTSTLSVTNNWGALAISFTQTSATTGSMLLMF
jgi:hypothetical protein